MKKLDFLPNRQNKYSIRKFTVGTASILLGTILISGATEEAKAAETTDTGSQTSTSDTTGSTDTSSTQAAETGAQTTNTQTESNTQPTDSSKEASSSTETQAPSSSTSGTADSTTAPKTSDAPTADSTQTTDNSTSATQAPDAAPAPETKADATNDQSAGDTAADTSKTQTDSGSSADTAQPSTDQPSGQNDTSNTTAPDSASGTTSGTTEAPKADAQAPSGDSTTTSQTTEAPKTDAPKTDAPKADAPTGTTDNTTSETQAPEAPTSESNTTQQQSGTADSTPTSGTQTTLSAPESGQTTAPDTSTVTSAPLAQDVTSALEGSTDQSKALTDYLATENNLSPETAQQVVDGMNVDLASASNEEISNALISSYLLNSQNAPGSEPLADASTLQAPAQSSQTSPTGTTMFRSLAAVQEPATQVGTWDGYVAAMNDTSVSNIQLTGDITANKLGSLTAGTGRSVTVDGGGYTLDTANYYLNAPVNSGNWDIKLQNTNLKTNNSEGFVNFAPSTTTQHTLTLRDVTHTGKNIINDTNINNNVTVNLEGNVTSTSTDNVVANATIGAKNINIAPYATVDMTRTGLGSAFQASDNGSITTGTGSTVNVDVSASNPWGVSNGNTAFKSGNNVTVQLGDGSTTNVTGQNIFDFGNGGTLNTGIGSTVNVDQKGNGNIVNMGKNSTFEVAQDSKFIAYSDGHRIGNWEQDNLIGLDGNSQILVDENATLFLDAKNHQWNPDTQTQVGAYNDLVNINAVGDETALLHVKDNATLDLRTDNRNYYAEVISIPLGGTNPDRRYIFDDAYYVNLQKTSKVTSGQSANGEKPNLIFMDPGSPGYFQWNGSYIAKTWDPLHFSDPNQHADADNVWQDVVDLRAEQEGFSTGVPTYNEQESTLTSTTGTPLSELNLNYTQRLVLISNNSTNPEAVPPETTTEVIPPGTTYQPNPDPTQPIGTETVITPGTPGEQTVTTKPGKDPVVVVTTPPQDEVVGVNNQEVATTPIPHDTTYVGVEQPVGYTNVRTPGQDGSTTTTTTYTVDPNTGELTNPVTDTTTVDPVTQVNEVGTQEVTTEQVPYTTLIRENPELPQGTQVEVQPGITGETQTTTTYTVNPTTGALENPTSNTVTTVEKQDRIIEVGVGTTAVVTNPIPPETTYEPNPDPNPETGTTTVITPGQPGEETVTTEPGKDPVTEVTTPPVTEVIGVDNESSVTTPIPHDVIDRYNPNLPVGSKDVLVQQGKDGSTTTTTTYTVDPNTGELSNPVTNTTTTPPVDHITEYGPVEGGTVYQPDPNLPVGETSTTPGTPGDPNDPNNPPTDTVVNVGNVQTETTPIPHDVIDRYNPNLPVGSKDVLVQQGKDGSTTTTTTYDVDPKTGELINPQTTTETTPPVDHITEYGPVEGGTVYQPDPNLPVGETSTTPGKPGDPNDPNNPPTDTVVNVGNVETNTTPVPHDTTYVGVDQPVGYTNVQTPGKDGSTTTTTTYEVDPNTGELTNPVTNTTTVDPVTQVNEVGTKQVTTEQVPYTTITRENPDLPAGTQIEVQPGITGENETTTTYTVNPETGALENPTSNTVTKVEKQDRIIEVGVGTTSVVTNPIPPETTYQPNPDPNPETGTTTVITPGQPGEETVTTEPGKDPVTEVTTPPVTEVVGVDNESTVTTPIPHKEINRYNPDLPVGSKDVLVQEGKDGSTTTTTTYDVDPKTGELTNPQTSTTTTPPVDRITEYGPVEGGTVYKPDPNLPVGETSTTPGKPGDPNDPNNPPTDTIVHVGNKTTETTPIPYNTIDRYNPELPVGAKDVVVQEGQNGSTTTTTTYDVDPKTGELINPRTETSTTPAVDRITEYGPVEGGTVYKPDPNLPVGETSTTPGKPGNPNDPNNPPTDTVIHVGNKVVEENDVPYETIYQDNPNLPVGTEREIQPGITGKTQTVTTYDVDPKTGELINPRTETVTVTDKQDRIIERGTGQPAPEQPGETPNQP
ncbi:G5 domain-containing protein, partial [Staphylococcus simulans]